MQLGTTCPLQQQQQQQHRTQRPQDKFLTNAGDKAASSQVSLPAARSDVVAEGLLDCCMALLQRCPVQSGEQLLELMERFAGIASLTSNTAAEEVSTQSEQPSCMSSSASRFALQSSHTFLCFVVCLLSCSRCHTGMLVSGHAGRSHKAFSTQIVLHVSRECMQIQWPTMAGLHVCHP